MRVNLGHSSNRLITLGGIILFIVSCMLTSEFYLLMLTAAQLIFVPLTLQLIVKIRKIHTIFIGLGILSVFLLNFPISNAGQMVLSSIYLLYTFFVALCGLWRFLNRGFVNWAEISIDFGMMYLFMGGIWFFIYTNGMDAGFTPLVNWLTAIHFHYSAFLLPISIGLFGRIHMSFLYRLIVPIILSGPMLVAIGITFWPMLEFISVLFYIFAIYSLIYLSLKARFASLLQAVFIRSSYSALGITILFSLLYATGRAFGNWYVGMDFMLMFHGFFNCVIFGLLGVLGWALKTPETKQPIWRFPVSKIRGKLKTSNTYKSGLVDNLSTFVDTKDLPSTITHFYEHTNQYRLMASVNWSSWFKPFLVVYKLISIQIQQLNLPISKEPIEMKGTIMEVDPFVDGRESPRAWVRKVNRSTVFMAIYSYHQNRGRTYMNIALPLPYSTMIGVLRLEEVGGSLVLSSEGEGDPGIYIAFSKILFKLPLSEYFLIKEIHAGELAATHKMRVFGIPFLTINYRITTKLQ